jgi:hypothetical protein
MLESVSHARVDRPHLTPPLQFRRYLHSRYEEGLLEANVEREFQRPVPLDTGAGHNRGAAGVSPYDPSPFVAAGYDWHYNEGRWVPFSEIVADPKAHGYVLAKRA